MLVRDASNTIRAIVGIAVRDSASVLRTVAAAFARDAALTRRTIFSALAVTIEPDSLVASGYSGGTIYPVTASALATPTGGTATYTYAWTVDNSWTVTSSTTDSTTFRSAGVSPGDFSTATGTVVVTDANGVTATADIPLTSYNTHP